MNISNYKKILAMTLIFAMVLFSIPVDYIGYADEEEIVYTTIPLNVKNSKRTASITVIYTGLDSEGGLVEKTLVSSHASGDTIFPVKTLPVYVTIQENPGNNNPFPGSVKYDTTETSQIIVAAPFQFIAGEVLSDGGYINYITSWKGVESNDNTLKEISVITEEPFDSENLNYTVLVESLDNKPDFGLYPIDPVGPVANNEFATIEIDETPALTTVTVTAENGDEKVYSFTFVVRPKPVITLNGENPLVFNDTSNDEYVDEDATALNADGNLLTVVMTDDDTVMLDTADIYYVNFNATDDVLVYRGNDRVYLSADAVTRTVIVYEYIYVIGIENYPDMLVYYGTDNPSMPTHATATLDNATTIQIPVLFNNGDPILNVTVPDLYLGELQMPNGINNPENLTADQQINIKNYEIIQDTTLDPIVIYYDELMPNLVTEVVAQLDNNRSELLNVQWDAGSVILDQGDNGFDGIKKILYEGDFTTEDGIDNTGLYKAYIEVHVKYYNVVSIVNPETNYEFGGTPYADVFSALDTTVTVNLDVGLPRVLNVNLDDLSGSYDPYADSVFNGELQLPDGVLNPNNFSSSQAVQIVDLMIVDAYDPNPQHVPAGTMLDSIVPATVTAVLNNGDEITVDVNFGPNEAVNNDVNITGNIINQPAHIGIEQGVDVTQIITVQKVIIVENEDGQIESDGVVLHIGYNRSPEEGFEQLYYSLLPTLEQSYSVEWQIVSGNTLIDLNEFGKVSGLNLGNAVVRVVVSYNHYLQDTSIEDFEYENMIFDDIPVQVIRYFPPVPPNDPPNDPPSDPPSVSIRLDKDPVELEYGTDALEEFLSYDLTETIFNSNSTDVTWSVDDDSVATIDQNGLVTAVAQGETIVTVRHNASGETATAEIIVFLVGDEPNPLGQVTFIEPYVTGYPDTTFRPRNSVTRAEVATMFAKILNLQIERPGGQIFNDVTPDKWYYAYVQAIRKTGIVEGDKSDNFRPDEAMTRAEIATVFAKYWQYIDIKVDSSAVEISDVDESHWASAYIYMMYNAGIVTGFSDGNFKPNDPTLREQVVGMINTLIARPPFEAEKSKFVDIDNTHWAYGNIEAASQIYLGTNKIFEE